MPTKQVHSLRVGDILLYKDEETYTTRTTDLAGENPRFDTRNTSDHVKVWGTQEALF